MDENDILAADGPISLFSHVKKSKMSQVAEKVAVAKDEDNKEDGGEDEDRE